MKKAKKIILGVSGSIAAFKAADIASLLLQKGCDVTVIMTKEAEHFITPLTLQMLSSNKVYRDMFDVTDAWDVEHVSLADSAGLILIAPATANIIAKLACGLCDDLLTCTVLASRAPVLLAPAMNDAMYQHKSTQANIERLKKLGYHFIGPVKGRLACGTVGLGRMSGVEDIISKAINLAR
jgi:phosphopantothenoylcysteine decarboxylase/phosphopantothenate--cysteine ligase